MLVELVSPRHDQPARSSPAPWDLAGEPLPEMTQRSLFQTELYTPVISSSPGSRFHSGTGCASAGAPDATPRQVWAKADELMEPFRLENLGYQRYPR